MWPPDMSLSDVAASCVAVLNADFVRGAVALCLALGVVSRITAWLRGIAD